MEIQGKDILFYVSTDLVTPAWKTMICVETLTVDWNTPINKRPTRCGTKVGIGVVEITMTGSSVADDAPSGTEISHKEMEGFLANGTPVLVKAAHATTPAKYFVSGTGYFSSLGENMPTDDMLDFTWQFDMTGTVDLVP
jgi:predicted secreted protein